MYDREEHEKHEVWDDDDPFVVKNLRLEASPPPGAAQWQLAVAVGSKAPGINE